MKRLVEVYSSKYYNSLKKLILINNVLAAVFQSFGKIMMKFINVKVTFN